MGWVFNKEVKATGYPAEISFGKSLQKASAERLLQRAKRVKASLSKELPADKRAKLEAELESIKVQFTVRAEALDEIQEL